ncbi:hypothetical protein PH213_20250 [Streptomyces sp. SRF1]|uniref:glycine-rich domain-containing protein n=1 Tax=Streptomyces sp. SRF1 TaxID=1549642 RepID=UPI0025B24095|nr:hypothetical protein [Streptomyces sp. SRF1]MDN3056838.1 hypothetical protein [Streptomyces sp. SRF1]
MASVCVCSDYFTINDDGELCLLPGRQGLRDVVVFNTPGTYQFRASRYPWLARVRVLAQGAGGGSAGANAASNQCVVRPGGAGGGYSESVLDVSALGAVESVVVGAGGSAGSGNAPGGAGGSSSFGGLVVAPGGDGGTAAQSSGTVADAVQGVAGAFAGTGQQSSGGGAGGGGIRLSGTNGLSGAGGESRLGHGGFPRSTEGPGTASRGYGGGAGGALSYGGAESGFEGGKGIVIVELYG